MYRLTRVILERSYDNFVSAPITVFDVTLPSMGTTALDDDFGCVSEEGAWLKRFPKVSAPYWRVKIPALGATIKPKVIGMHLSSSFTFECWRPTGPDALETGGDTAESDAGWQAVAPPWTRRADVIRIQLTSVFQYEQARTAFRHWHLRRPVWYVPDEDNARNAMCIAKPPSLQGFHREAGWYPERADIPYIEHEALNG